MPRPRQHFTRRVGLYTALTLAGTVLTDLIALFWYLDRLNDAYLPAYRLAFIVSLGLTLVAGVAVAAGNLPERALREPGEE